MRHTRIRIEAISLAVLLCLGGGGLGVAQGADESQVERAMSDRAEYGFDAGRGTVVQLLESGGAPESEAYGFPMTRGEADELYRRTGFVQSLSEETLPYVEQLDGYAGHWIDQQARGQLVVLLTKITPAAKSGVRARMWWRHSSKYDAAYGPVGKKQSSPYDDGDKRDLMVVKI